MALSWPLWLFFFCELFGILFSCFVVCRDRARQQHHKRMKKFMRHGHYDRNPVCLCVRAYVCTCVTHHSQYMWCIHVYVCD